MGRKRIVRGDPQGEWIAWKHRMGYSWDEIGAALHISGNTARYQAIESGEPYLRPTLHRPKALRRGDGLREWAWESLLEGYTKPEIAQAAGERLDYIEELLKNRKKIMPPLVTTWIFGWKGSKK